MTYSTSNKNPWERAVQGGTEETFGGVMVESFPDLMKTMNS